MIKFLEDIPDSRFNCCDNVAFGEIMDLTKAVGVRVDEIIRNEGWPHWQDIYWSSRSKNIGANQKPRSGNPDHTEFLSALRLEKLCNDKPGLKEAIKKADALGIRPGVTVQWENKPAFVVPAYEKWDLSWGDNWAWFSTFGAPHGRCWLIGSEYTPKVVGTVTPVDDDIIRVGDWVRRVSGGRSGPVEEGFEGIVTQMSTDKVTLSVDETESGHFTRNFKKIKAGGPVSTTNNQTHGQVQGTSQQDSGGTRGRTVERPDAGRQGATGSGHPGKRASKPPSRFRGAIGVVRFTL